MTSHSPVHAFRATRIWRAAAIAVALASSSRVAAQVLIGSPADDRLRLEAILGRRTLAGSLIRSPSASTAASDSSPNAFSWSLVGPVVDGANNSRIPFSLNEGSLWAGRGLSARLTTGVTARIGPVHALLAPEITHSANEGFPLLPAVTPGRSDYSNPFHAGPRSIDLPVRFGADPLQTVTPGQSAFWVALAGADVGVSTENQWWGPAVQNALIMSNNAAGIPEAFVRTNHPLATRIGTFEGKVIAGALTESLFFDADSSNDRRSLSAFVATFAPAAEPNFVAGVARAVYSRAPRTSDFAQNALGSFTRWSTTRSDSTKVGSDAFDQLFSLFARWVFPDNGLELYGEWARMLPPVSLRDWLVAPQRTQAYTLGLQVARPVRGNALLRFQAEFTDLEQVASSLAGDTLTYYTSRSAPQGYTQRGKTVGAAIGPGSSSQMLALDYMPKRWDIGVFAQRIRWDNDVYALQPTGFSFFSHDVTVLAGLRGTVRLLRTELHAEFSTQQRINFLFQNLRGGYGLERSNDVLNNSLRFWVEPWTH